MKYRKRPVIIEAVQWTGTVTPAVERLLGKQKVLLKGASLLIPTLEGVMEARPGDYIIRGGKRGVIPVQAGYF